MGVIYYVKKDALSGVLIFEIFSDFGEIRYEDSANIAAEFCGNLPKESRSFYGSK
jgi:hypothetical protein